VTAVQVLPFLELVRLSTRVGRGFEYAAFDSLHPLSVIRFIIPNVVGVLREGTAWARGGSVYGYTGVISLLLALFAAKKNRYVRFFFIAAVISFLLALGKYTPVFRLAYLFVPGIAAFRSPQHFLLLYTFSIAVLAGFGLDEWRGVRRRIGVIGEIGIIGVIGGILLLKSVAIVPDAIVQVASVYPTRALEKLQNFSPEVVKTIIELVAKNLLITSGLLIAAVFIRGKRCPQLIIGLVFLELFLFSRNNLLSVPNETATQWLATVKEKAQQRRDVDWRQYRVYTDPSIYPYPGKKQFGVFDWDRESAWQAEILRPNLNMVAHLPAIDGYASLIYRDYAEYLNKKQTDPTGVTLDDPMDAKKRRLGVGANASPRLFLVTNEKESAEGIQIGKYTPNEVSVTVTTEKTGTLVFIDTNYPGWRAVLDGKPVAIQPFENVFKSVIIPAGTHAATFRYRPDNVNIGLGLSSLGVLTIAIVCWKRRV
ncbi:YfhO family protein, partial [Candidatus Gottesmanbacteria bacterium]|nr:YfhO family protein [Candidatus Gottesmanbacteria bacterium]